MAQLVACHAGGRKFDFGRTNTQGLEKRRQGGCGNTGLLVEHFRLFFTDGQAPLLRSAVETVYENLDGLAAVLFLPKPASLRTGAC